MADVTLRESLGLMRSYLHGGHLAEAFALGRHILQFYPKHIETYTVLAQVSLATNDIAGANDLLRRVLSSDPENVIALAGMALISEAQDKQDDALWYLERAYEIQPSNDELRGELLRVREQYYGTAPTRVELTPGALARVYARQGQYANAINEFRRLLRSESQRYDAQVGLAETLYRAGRTDEAAKIAQEVMRDAPYSLKPNLILGALWTENAVPEGQQFLQRAHQLDPEHRVARDLLGERFNGTEPPRLPVMGESIEVQTVPPPPMPQPDEEAFPLESDTARAALLLSEIERGQEPIVPYEEPYIPGSEPIGTAAKIAAGAVALDLASDAMTGKPDPVAESDIVAPQPETGSIPESSAPAAATVVVAEEVAPSGDSTIQEIADAERVHAAGSQSTTPPSSDVEKASRGKSEGIPTGAVAAAAAALAASIALDKSNQPAPTRRTHSAIPKVRPVIPGNTANLPPWLYLSATPANANATFDALSPTTKEMVAPLGGEPDRPDWLVQAEAARANEPVSVSVNDELPDWLKPAALAGAAAAVASRATTPQDESKSQAAQEVVTVNSPDTELPEWLQESDASPAPVADLLASSFDSVPAADETGSIERPSTAASLSSMTGVPSSGSELNPAVPIVAAAAAAMLQHASNDEPPALSIPPAAQETTASGPRVDEISFAPDSPVVSDELADNLPVAAAAQIAGQSDPTSETPSAEPSPPSQAALDRPASQAVPDSATMLQMARDKRDSGDLKGALELYERVMHRRPNHIDQVTSDLEAIVSSGAAPLTANRLLGEAYAMVGRFKESLVQYRTALGKPPTGP